MKIFDVIEDKGWRLLADSSMMRTNNPFFVPEFDGGVLGHPALAFRASRLGKSIAPRFAQRYFSEFAPALIFRADAYADSLRKRGLSDSPASVFDRAFVVGEFVSLDKLKGDKVLFCADNQQWTLDSPLNALASALENVTLDNTLKMGDLLVIEASGRGLEPSINSTISLKVAIGDPKPLELILKVK